jgi:hypothetical protein
MQAGRHIDGAVLKTALLDLSGERTCCGKAECVARCDFTVSSAKQEVVPSIRWLRVRVPSSSLNCLARQIVNQRVDLPALSRRAKFRPQSGAVDSLERGRFGYTPLDVGHIIDSVFSIRAALHFGGKPGSCIAA